MAAADERKKTKTFDRSRKPQHEFGLWENLELNYLY